MDHVAVRRLIEKRRVATIQLLTQARFEEVEPMLLLLKRLRPAEEISSALMERMAIAPLSEFVALKRLYYQHFAVRVQ